MGVDPSAVLGLFAKEPRPGLVKSRLAGETGPEWAAEVAAAFLSDLTERLREVPVRRVLVYAPPTAEAYFHHLAAGEFDLFSQCDGDLGKRMMQFVEAQFQAGAKKVVLLGMDSPTVPVEFVTEAVAALDRVDVVVGPATDGGYYLIGYRQLVPELFQGISWSRETVLRETVERCQRHGLDLHLLPPWYDVDTLADWRMLQGHLAAMRVAGVEMKVPRTEQLCKEQGSDG